MLVSATVEGDGNGSVWDGYWLVGRGHVGVDEIPNREKDLIRRTVTVAVCLLTLSSKKAS